MKKYLLIVVTISLLIVSCSTDDYPTKFSFSPEKPKINEEIQIKYKSDDDELNNSAAVNMMVYNYAEELLKTEKVAMEKKGEGWLAKYTPSEKTKGIVIKFVSENEKDDNNELGYVIKLYDNNGGLVTGANAGLANFYSKYSGILDMVASRDSITGLFETEFAKNPELKRNYLLQYINSIPRKERRNIAIPELEKLELADNLTPEDYETLSSGFKGAGDHVKAEKYYEIVKKELPKSKLVESKYYVRFRNMLRSDKMLNVFNEFNKVNPTSDLNNYMVSAIVNKLVSDQEYAQASKILDKYENYVSSNVYNSVAWKLFENNTDLDIAKKYSEKGVELARQELSSPSGEKPLYFDADDWKESKKASLAMILDTYGNIQNKLDNKTEALKLFEEAVKLTNKEETGINENYTSLLFELGENDKAKSLLEELVGEGKATEKMRSTLSEIFAKEGGPEENFDEYVGKFEEKAKEKLIKKLSKEMKDEIAPDFELQDMEGNSVKLSDFKDKTVIVDFWATWCGPCLQSFPVMKKAVEKYAENENVKFLFVNTWERVDDKKKNAEEFLQRTKYPFHVLLDESNEVVEKFGVQGIPTKFIVDGKGKIRFQSVGFSGVEKEVLEELDLMIEMAQ